MSLIHHLNWNLNEFDHIQTWSSSKFKHIQTTPGQVSTGWFELIWTSPLIRNARFQIMNNPKYPLFPSFNMFQIGGFAWTAKTTLGNLWEPLLDLDRHVGWFFPRFIGILGGRRPARTGSIPATLGSDDRRSRHGFPLERSAPLVKGLWTDASRARFKSWLLGWPWL